MQYCTKCVIPSTRPGISFNEQGVCSACQHAEEANKVNWKHRFKELKQLAKKYRKSKGYDCIIAVSGGKDSTFQIHVVKNILKLHPLLVNVYNFSWTQTGLDNFNNMSEQFGCDTISLHLNRKVAKPMMRKAFEQYGSPTWYWDRAVYCFPIMMGIKLGIPLIFYGENINYQYGGQYNEETPSALNQIKNDVVKPIELKDWVDENISLNDLNACVYPTKTAIKEAKLNPVYLSYYVSWSGYRNMVKARTLGFKTLEDTKEWTREGFIEQYDQIDSPGYLVHPWMKFPKYGHARVTDVASSLIREGRMTREEAVVAVNNEDYKLDPKALDDFLSFTGYTKDEFNAIVDKFANQEYVQKIEGVWKLKNPAV
jgi:N-acetyl sugar amidotransferase